MSYEDKEHKKFLENSCIHKVPIFSDLDFKEMLELAKITTNRRYQKGEFLFLAGDMNSGLFVIHKGSAKVFRSSEWGKEQVLRILRAGDFLGELSLFNNSAALSSAEALEDIEACVINGEKLKELMGKVPSIALKVISEFSKRLMVAESMIEHLGIYDVEQRAASILLQLSKEEREIGREEFTLSMSKKDLASYMGITQETLSRKLSSFQERGLIKLTGQRKIEILDEKRLLEIAAYR